MKLLSGLEHSAVCHGGFVSIGNFDGVHRGHRTMIARLIDRARSAGVPAVVMTFNPHPITILRPEAAPPPLTTLARKVRLLEECGVDCVVAYPTDRALLELSPEQFFQSIIREKFQARGLVEGENFFYGHDRAGTVETLQTACAAAGLTLDIITPVQIGDRIVSSSLIRRLVAAGEVAEAAELLGTSYSVQGVVTTGAARGRTIGFPTANLTEIETVLPLDGVYAGRVDWQGRRYRAAINLGTNPTFSENRRKFEVHLLDFQGDLYGQVLSVELIARLRGTKPFASAADLVQQLQVDLASTRTLVPLK